MSLMQIYEQYFKVGTSVSERNLFSAEAKQEILKHYNSITAENGMKPMYILDRIANTEEPEKYNLNPALRFDSARKYLEFAKENNIALRGHTLVWHNQTPDWFFRKDYSTDKEAPLADREVMLARLEGYIWGILTFVQTEYPGVIYAWDVVNEVIEESEENGWRKSLWYKTVGEDFVLQAFRLARKYAQPNVKLFYNDYSTFIPKKREYIESLILKPLMAENLVDGMGMQSHLMLKYHDLTEYEKSLKAYAALGLEIHITELDIHNPDPSEEGQEQMAFMYRQLFTILVRAQKEDGANIASVTFWGMKDDESWLTGFRKEKSYPLLFGENYDLKPAYFAVADVPEHIFSKSKKIIAAGHICLDITPVFPDKKVTRLDTLLSPGKLVQTGAADVHTGGSVANTGLALKLLGAEVSLMGKIGCDAFGDMICNILKKYDADEHMIKSPEESTSYSVVLAIPGIDRIFLHNPGANGTFCSSDIDPKALQDAALFHFGYPTLMRAMYENDGQELITLMKAVKEAGVSTSLDMAAVDADSEAGRVEWNGILRELLPYVDFFVPSVEELCFMLDKARFEEWQQRAAGKDITEVLDIEKDVKPLADICMSYGAKVLLIKCGVPGIYYRTAEDSKLEEVGSKINLDMETWAGKEGFEASYVPERVLSGTGAGDTSIAAFLAAVLNGESLEEAMHLATAAGASCVTAYDALSGLKTLDELKAKIKAGWQKNGEVTLC